VNKNGHAPLLQLVEKNTKVSHHIATKHVTTEIQD